MKRYSYSIIIPCHNESGNIRECIRRIPKLRRDYEIIVVNDGSRDNTSEVVGEILKSNKRVKLIDYKINRGKGYATCKGLDSGTKDILIILDADMSVKPEDIPRFIESFESGAAEFANGTRMVYPLTKEAMKPLHIIGNKIFSIIFSCLLNQKITDTLCGTKCLFRKDYKKMTMKDDAWPDFDLLIGAAKLDLKIAEIPVLYQKRMYGRSHMITLKHGWMLLKAAVSGFIELRRYRLSKGC